MGVNLKTSFYSPLRYPGGKGKLSFYVQLLYKYNLLTDGHYVEPYAGGASVALSMLINEYASVIHINDYDYLIYAFWRSVVHDTDKLCELIEKTPITVESWRFQKEVQLKPENYSLAEVGFSTFFLNRANRSGILKAGIIGGKEQTGEWKIDARFNKEDLIGRIQKIARYRERINIYNSDAINLVGELKKILPSKTFYYFDPPYYNKGKELYINFYEHADHARIASVIDSMKNDYWLVSYDNDINIKKLYLDYRSQVYDLNYHAGKAAKGTEVMIFSDKMLVPNIANPSSKEEIKYYSKNGLYGEWAARR